MKGARGLAAGALTLIALQVFSTGRGPERGGQLVAWVGTGLRAFMAPDVPGVPRVAAAPAPAASRPDRNDNEIGGGGPTLPRNPTLST